MEKIRTIKTGLKVKFEECQPDLESVTITQTEFGGATKEQLQLIKNLLVEKKALTKSETIDEDIEYVDNLIKMYQK